MGIGRLVAQVVGHPYHSVDLYRAVVLALVIQALGRIAGAIVGIDIRASAGFRAGSTARFSTGLRARAAASLTARFSTRLRARAAAGILSVIGIFPARISGARQFSAIDPIGYLAAQTDLDLQRAVVRNDDRKIVAPAAFERRIFDRLRTGLTIAERYGNCQRRLLRNEDRPVDGVGNHLVGPDRSRTRIGPDYGFGNRKIHKGIDGRTSDRHLDDRRAGLIRDLDRKLRHQMIERHADGSLAGNDTPLNRAQQIGRLVTKPLFDRDTELGRCSRIGVGVVGRQGG